MKIGRGKEKKGYIKIMVLIGLTSGSHGDGIKEESRSKGPFIVVTMSLIMTATIMILLFLGHFSRE